MQKITASFALNTGTWFSAALFYIKDHLDADFLFSSIISMSSLTLLVMQIYLHYIKIKNEKQNKK